MQPGLDPAPSPMDAARAATLERVILAVRRHWFAAASSDLGCAVGLVESGGELISLVDGDSEQADALVANAALRGAYVVATSFSQPPDLALRLRRQGFRLIQRHGVYVFEPGVRRAPVRHGLLSRLLWREPLSVTVHKADAGEIPVWNEVCWRAFGPRGTLEASLQEKQQAFCSMGSAGSWYLAVAEGRAVGTACMFCTPEASQVLAVGTLPAFRGRGIASALMAQVIRDWESGDAGLLFLDASPGSVAERLYLRIGFRAVYVRELYVPVRGVGLT